MASRSSGPPSLARSRDARELLDRFCDLGSRGVHVVLELRLRDIGALEPGEPLPGFAHGLGDLRALVGDAFEAGLGLLQARVGFDDAATRRVLLLARAEHGFDRGVELVGDVGGSGAAGAGRDHVLGGQDAGRHVHREGRLERVEVLGGTRHERQAWVQDEPRDPLGAGLEAREHRVGVTELRGFRPVAVAHGSTRLLGFPSAQRAQELSVGAGGYSAPAGYSSRDQPRQVGEPWTRPSSSSC